MLQLKGKYCKDCKIFTDNIEQSALSMIYRFLDNPMFEGSKIRIMPDVHAGKDIVVGFTVPFTDHVNPDHVGGDIGCSVSTTITDQPVNPDEYPVIEKNIRDSVKFGMSVHQNALYNYSELYDHLRQKQEEVHQKYPGIVDYIDLSENGITDFLKRLDDSEHLFYHSIGTVGGGNHFVEVGITPKGNYAFTVHCGSRNLVQKVWKYWKSVADNQNNNGFLFGESMKGYLTDMMVAQAYSEFNHIVINRLVLEAINKSCGKEVNVEDYIYTAHNYIDFTSMILRKGAVAATKGRRLVIPFNMRDGLIVASGKGNEDWNFSAPHGAGRLLSRSDAKALIDLEEYKQSMNGIYSTSVNEGTVDESPMAYKGTKEILSLIKDTVDVEYFIRPVINLKATK